MKEDILFYGCKNDIDCRGGYVFVLLLNKIFIILFVFFFIDN